MFNHTLIKRSLAVGLLTAAAGFPAGAQAAHIMQPALPTAQPTGVPSIGPGLAVAHQLNQLQGNVQQSVAKHGDFTAATALGPTDASSGGYGLPASVVSTTAQPGTSFHWGDAGIGAGSAILLLGTSSLGMVAIRRRRPQRTLAS